MLLDWPGLVGLAKMGKYMIFFAGNGLLGACAFLGANVPARLTGLVHSLLTQSGTGALPSGFLNWGGTSRSHFSLPTYIYSSRLALPWDLLNIHFFSCTPWELCNLLLTKLDSRPWSMEASMSTSLSL